jgi:hypothetical protein
MAKKKAASASTSTAKAPKKASSKTTSNGDSSTAAAALGTEQIGMAAGSVWMYLSDNGETTLTALKKELGGPAEVVLAAVGWLAREEKLDFTVSGKTVKVALK